MKGDFTRFTFRPEKHYTSVLMQQGRLQLDSDWNEQVSIQAHLNQTQMQDTIGGTAGTPDGDTREGFKIVLTPDGNDLIIRPGSFYVNGILCQLAQGSEFSAPLISMGGSKLIDVVEVKVSDTTIDEKPLEKNQWVRSTIAEQAFLIVAVDRDQKTLKLTTPEGEVPTISQVSSKLMRVGSTTDQSIDVISIVVEVKVSSTTIAGQPLEKNQRVKSTIAEQPFLIMDLNHAQKTLKLITSEGDAATTIIDVVSIVSSKTEVPNKLIVKAPLLAVDGQRLVQGQWLETPSSGQMPPVQLQIEAVPGETLTLTLPGKQLPPQLESGRNKFTFRRLTTYTNQPDYPNPPQFSLNKRCLIYLDVWQRHVTAIEDPDIREIALADIPDTTTRAQTIWQVKLLELHDPATTPQGTDTANLETNPEWLQLTQTVSGLLTVKAASINAGMSDSGLENQLYRVEIHKGGASQKATFKWSKDNGTVVSAIKTINDQDSTITLPRPSRDSLLSFKAGQWVEVTDEERELKNLPGTMVRLKDVLVKAEERLLFDPVTADGDPINAQNFPPERNPKVRRWDQNAAALKVAFDANGIELEKGVSVQFYGEDGSTLRSGDYWLIPTRMNPVKPIAWPQDDEGNPIFQPPLGIQHRFGLLALVESPQPASAIDQKTPGVTDKRLVFPSLINCFNKNGDFFSGSLGIGVTPPAAKLHIVNTPEAKKGKVSASQGSTTVTGDSKTRFLQDVQPGGEIILTDPATREAIVGTVVEVKNDQLLTVKQTFDVTLSNVPFTYQQAAVIRGDVLTNDNGTLKSVPQFLLSSQGKVGIGTSDPADKLHVDGTVRIGTATDYVQVKQDNQQVDFVTTGKAYHFDQDITVETGVISAGVTDNATNLSLKTSDLERIGVTKDGKVSISAPKSGTSLEIKGTTAAATPDSILQVTVNDSSLFAVQNDGIALVGNKTTNSALQVLGKTAIGREVEVTSTPDNGLLVQGNIYAQSKVGIGIAPDNTSPEFCVKGTARIGNEAHFVDISVPAVNPPAANPSVIFTAPAADGYTFDRGITLQSGNLVVGQGNATVANNLTVNSGNVTLAQGSLSVGGTATIANGLTINSGSLTLKSGTISSGSSGSNKPLSLGTNGAERVQLAADGNVSIRTKAVIGINFADNGSRPLDNGLLVEGNVGIGVSTPSGEDAKLQVKSTSPSAEFAVKVTSGVSSENSLQDLPLFSIQNNGNVTIDNHLRAGDVTVSKRLLVIGDPTKIRHGSENSSLYVEGTIFAEDVTTDQFRVFSSRTLKDNITDLSSKEVDAILRGLNPVKYTYKTDNSQTLHFGFIAEDMPEVIASPDRQTVNPVDIVATLTKVIKDHRQAIISLNKLVKEQQAAIAALQGKVDVLENSGNRSR